MTHFIITLGYPAARAFIAEQNKLQLFTDAMTIIAMAMIIGGIVYALVLRGDFDISAFVMRRGMKRDDMRNPLPNSLSRDCLRLSLNKNLRLSQ